MLPLPNPDMDQVTSVSLNIRLFGRLAVLIGNKPLPALRTRKGAWLLALLLLRHPQPVERVWLAATLWPDSDHKESLKNLRDSLHDLRKALGEQAKRLLSPMSGTLTLDLQGAEVDLLTFDASIAQGDAASLERALRLYNGFLLEGCQEEWVILERDRRHWMCLDALEALAESDSNNGLNHRSVQRLRNCVALDPLRETAQRALMGALANTGDYSGATQVYREFRLYLHEELQSSPAAETIALYEQIRIRARQIASRTIAFVLPLPTDGLEPTVASGMEAELSTPVASSNLPRSVTSFIGREREITEIRTLMQAAPLLTLIGAGGSGKTRLALKIAAELPAPFPDGAWFIELASLSDPLLVPQALTSLFAVRDRLGTPRMQTLIDALASRHLLLVLDNCEHLLAACAQLAAVLLRFCPGVRLLATSRERLGIAGEQTYHVPSLTLPDLSEAATIENIDRSEAIRLFVERAKLSKNDFVVTAQNVSSLASLCRRLDGIPLALEMAAAWVRALSVEDIVARLVGQFDLLTGGDRSALPRHQTLRALIDWSYDLLNLQERLLLQRLSVFPGGWTLEAAEKVGDGSPLEEHQILELLTSLVDKSLVLAEDRGGSIRYRMFDTMRHYAMEKLHASGEAEPNYARRRRWFLALTEEAARLCRAGVDDKRWLQRLEPEYDNLSATLAQASVDAEGDQEVLQIAEFLSYARTMAELSASGRK